MRHAFEILISLTKEERLIEKYQLSSIHQALESSVSNNKLYQLCKQTGSTCVVTSERERQRDRETFFLGLKLLAGPGALQIFFSYNLPGPRIYSNRPGCNPALIRFLTHAQLCYDSFLVQILLFFRVQNVLVTSR